MWVADVRCIICDSFTSLLQACSNGPFLELGLDLPSERPWCVPSWQVCMTILGKWGGKGVYGWEKKHSLWSGWAGSCSWRKDGSVILQHPQFSTQFRKGLALELMVQSTFHWWHLASWAQSTFHWWDLASCSDTDHSQTPPSWGVRHHTAAPGPGGPATWAQKHQCVWIASSHAVLIHAIVLLKMGAASFLGAG